MMLKYCACEHPLKPNNPRYTGCNRCGYKIPPPKKVVPLKYHCARCLNDIPTSGACYGAFYMMAPAQQTREMVRFCETCSLDILEYGVQRFTPHPLHEGV